MEIAIICLKSFQICRRAHHGVLRRAQWVRATDEIYVGTQRRRFVNTDATTRRSLSAPRVPCPPSTAATAITAAVVGPFLRQRPQRRVSCYCVALPLRNAGYNGLQSADAPATTNQHRIGKLQSHFRLQ